MIYNYLFKAYVSYNDGIGSKMVISKSADGISPRSFTVLQQLFILIFALNWADKFYYVTFCYVLILLVNTLLN